MISQRRGQEGVAVHVMPEFMGPSTTSFYGRETAGLPSSRIGKLISRCEKGWLIAAAGLFLAMAFLSHGAAYLDNATLEKELRDLAQKHPSFIHLTNLATTVQSNAIWLIEIGWGTLAERAARPGMLVSGGLEGNELISTTSCVEWIRELTQGGTNRAELDQLLNTTTFYVMPRGNPDAAARFFVSPRTESALNSRATDDDHDGLLDEDGPEDLNHDGMITSMRVEDVAGEFLLDPTDSRLMLKADKAKGEVGRWRVLSEGRDNDLDEAWNEDGPGGVNPNRNFPYDYRFFAPGSGPHQVSEVESRAVADFVIKHPNIAVGVTFGAADNLLQTPKTEAPKRFPVTIRQEDVGYYRELGRIYREALGLKKELSGRSEPGTLSDWLYYYRGRLSLAVQPWSPALQAELPKKVRAPGNDSDETETKETEKTGRKRPEDEKDIADKSEPDKAPSQPSKPMPGSDEKRDPKPKSEDDRNAAERTFLQWLDQRNTNAFAAWQRIEHPDFPDQVVEVGGLSPFARSNPPTNVLASLVQAHSRFLTAVAGKLPRLGIRKVTVKPLGESVFEVTVAVENTGYLPTVLGRGKCRRKSIRRD